VIRIVFENLAGQQRFPDLGHGDALGVGLLIGVAGEAILVALHRTPDVT